MKVVALRAHRNNGSAVHPRISGAGICRLRQGLAGC
jgi:hypothetical protein